MYARSLITSFTDPSLLQQTASCAPSHPRLWSEVTAAMSLSLLSVFEAQVTFPACVGGSSGGRRAASMCRSHGAPAPAAPSLHFAHLTFQSHLARLTFPSHLAHLTFPSHLPVPPCPSHLPISPSHLTMPISPCPSHLNHLTFPISTCPPHRFHLNGSIPPFSRAVAGPVHMTSSQHGSYSDGVLIPQIDIFTGPALIFLLGQYWYL